MALQLADGAVSLVDGGRRLTSVDAPAAVPYRIIRPSEPAIVTTCGADLVPVTYVIADNALRFPNMVPQLVEPPVIALFSLFAEEDAPGGRVVLIAPDGSLAWQHANAQLLLPAVGQAGGPVLVAPCSGSLQQPFGETPSVFAVDPRTGEVKWRTDLPVLGAPDDVELLCRTGGYGLLVVQYGYTLFHYLSVNLATGEMSALYQLAGQPSVVIVQPGAMPRYRGLSATGNTARLLVVDEREGAGEIVFDLAAGTMEFTPQDIIGPGTTEQNSLAVGGGAADPAAPPYPQSLLPTAYGADWQIPALVKGDKFLLVEGQQASWVQF